jgi:hypothetical protein
MKRSLTLALMMVALASCREYDLQSRLINQQGLVPPDQFERYGREQAEEMAVAREFGAGIKGSATKDLMVSAEAATSYALTLPDIADAQPDPLGLQLTLRFKSGWRTMVIPIEDGKRGGQTAGLPAGAGAKTAQ